MAISMHMDASDTDTNRLSSAGSKPPAANSFTPYEEEVRAPIPQKREVLVEHDSYLAASYHKRRRRETNSVFDKFRDFQAEARQQERLLQDGSGTSASTSSSSVRSIPSDHLIKLEDLFRPPLDIIHHGTLASAQARGQLENKWILVNIQNTSEFSCQVLNRDIWKDVAIRSIVDSHFIFWQVYHDSAEGQKYMQFYPVDSWPYISVLHPLTAELEKHWSVVKLQVFRQDLEEFVLVHSKPDGKPAETVAARLEGSPAKIRVDPVIEETEESQIQAAIKASLQLVKKKEKTKLVFESDSDEEEEFSEVETFSASDDESELNKKGKEPQSGSPVKKSSSHSIATNGESHSYTENNSTATKKKESTDWTDYTSDKGSDIHILFKKPDQTRCQWCVKSQSTLKALSLYVNSLGFDSQKYEIVANFPRRNISDIPLDKKFDEANFQKQETLYIQAR